ncbi:MAG: ParB/RepB/Spo0J family partition protein [Pseudomonadota bacterium]
MTGKKHDAVFDDVLSGIDSADAAPAPRAGARFLKRSTSIGERMAGEREEKVLHWVDPDACRMWERHNREYALLTEDNCRDLIDGIRAQGRQEFPAIVRRLEGEAQQYEVICGARRHYAVSWLRANNYPQFRYLVEVRDLTDEEAFRLADIENRDRDDISDYERARDYAQAIELYYGGKQKAMAARLEVSEGWLSRYLGLARLPQEVVGAFASIRDLKELHARTLKPLLAKPQDRAAILAEAAAIARDQAAARAGQGAPLEPAQVLVRLKAAAVPARPARAAAKRYSPDTVEGGITARRSGRKTVLEVPDTLSRSAVETALAQFVADRFGDA